MKRDNTSFVICFSVKKCLDFQLVISSEKIAYTILDPHLISIKFRIRIVDNQPIALMIEEISPEAKSEKQPFALYCRFWEGKKLPL